MIRYEWKKLSRSSVFWIVCITLMILHILFCLFTPAEITDSISAEEYRAGLIRVIEDAKWNLEDYRLYGDGYLVRYQEKVIETYQKLLDAEIVPMTVKGWDIYFANQKCDLLWMLCAVFFGVHLVMLERNQRMYVLNHLTLRRKKMLLGKAWLLFLLSVCVMTLFMTISLILIAIRLGFSPLDTPLCSIRDFQYCPYPLTVGNYLLISFLMKIMQFFILTLMGANFAKLFSGYLQSLFSGVGILGVGYLLPNEDAFGSFSSLFERYRAVNLFGFPVSAVGFMCCISIGVLIVLLVYFLSYFAKYILEPFWVQGKRTLIFRQVKKHTLLWYEAKKMLGSAKVIILIFAILICKVGYGFWRAPQADTTEEIYKKLCFSLAGEVTEEKYAYMQSELASMSAILGQKENMHFALQSGEIDREAFDEYLQTYYDAEHRHAALLRLEAQYLRAVSAGGDILYDSGWLLFFGLPIDIFQTVLLLMVCFGYYEVEHKNGVCRLLQTTVNGKKKIFRTKQIIAFLFALLIFIVFFSMDFLLIALEFPMNNSDLSFASLGMINASLTLGQASVLFVLFRSVANLLFTIVLIVFGEKIQRRVVKK